MLLFFFETGGVYVRESHVMICEHNSVSRDFHVWPGFLRKPAWVGTYNLCVDVLRRYPYLVSAATWSRWSATICR